MSENEMKQMAQKEMEKHGELEDDCENERKKLNEMHCWKS